MRTKRIKLYSFNELSTEAQDKAVTQYQNEYKYFKYSKAKARDFLERGLSEHEFLSDGTIYNQ